MPSSGLLRSFLLLCLFGPAFADDSLKVTQVVHDLAAKCEAAKAYSFEGELLLVGQRGSAPGRVLSKAKVTLATAGGGKYLLRVEPVDKDEYLLVSDGQKSWAYVLKLKQYTEQESAAVTSGSDEDEDSQGAESDQERDLAETYAHAVMVNLTSLYKTAQAADLKGYDTVKVGGKKQALPVIRVLARKDKSGGQALTELTMDPATFTISRYDWATLSSSNGEKTVLRLTMNFNNFRLARRYRIRASCSTLRRKRSWWTRFPFRGKADRSC